MRFNPTILTVIFTMLLQAAPSRAEKIVVSAAVSLKDALTQIASEFEKQSGNEIELQFGASGQLAAQIRQGAPVDLFISAARKQVEDLAKDKIVDASTTQTIAGNALVLVVPGKANAAASTFSDLADPRFKRIAVGDPKTVPAGDYANQALAALGLAEKVKDRLIFGTNVRQVLSYVEKNEVDAGIVYRTDARESGDLVRVMAEIDAKLHEPIEYPAVLVTQSKHRAVAAKFLEHLRSDSARSVLLAKGFAPPAKGPTTRP